MTRLTPQEIADIIFQKEGRPSRQQTAERSIRQAGIELQQYGFPGNFAMDFCMNSFLPVMMEPLKERVAEIYPDQAEAIMNSIKFHAHGHLGLIFPFRDLQDTILDEEFEANLYEKFVAMLEDVPLAHDPASFAQKPQLN